MKSFLRTLAVAAPAGALFHTLGSPLPWVIGPLVACALVNLSGAGLTCPRRARQAGQWVIGTVLGLYFTPAVLGQIGELAPWVALSVTYTVLLGLAIAWVLRRTTGVSTPTAFFSGAIGGASEMALQGERHGGRIDAIAAAHALRLVLVVITLPFAYQWLGLRGEQVHESISVPVDYAGLAALVLVTSLAAMAVRRLGGPNAWVLGPLAATLVLTASGAQWTSLPTWVIVSGQILIGASLGTRFSPEFFAQAPRFLSMVALATLAAIALSAVFATGLSRLAGLPVATLVLATSPGGIAEMTLTAKTLALGVPVVTVFHVIRMVFMVLAVGPLYRTLARWRGWEQGGPARIGS